MKKSNRDKDGLFELILNAPEHLQYGVDLNLELEKLEFKRLILAGMGGSAISGMILRDIIPSYCDTPVNVFSQEDIPCCQKDDLLIAVSYSGGTGETLSMLKSFKGKDVFGISSNENFGGKTLIVPGGLPPRYAFYYIFSVLIKLVSGITSCKKMTDDLRTASHSLKDTIDTLKKEEGPVDSALSAFEKKIPVIYAPSGLKGVGYRWKTQLNENAKRHAFNHFFPEMCHNEIVPYISGEDALLPILLRSSREGDLERKQMDYFSEFTGLEFEFSSENPIEETLKMVILGDLISYGLAERNDIDPKTIVMIDKLKGILRK